MKRDRQHVCDFTVTDRKPGLVFTCSQCDTTHICGSDTCDSLFYNSDHTRVCTITGMCFEQRMCEAFADPSRSYVNDDPVYFKRTKRDQQIKNKILERLHTMKIIECAAQVIDLTGTQHDKLCAKIMTLWTEFVTQTSSMNQYVHRKDKRCFVVAITMSLDTGIKNNLGCFIVLPHGHIKRAKINKKSKYGEFAVTDIRYGQNLIKKVFRGIMIDTGTRVNIH